MANYDEPAAVYDGGLYYDAAPPPQPRNRMAKIKVKLNLKEKSDANLLTFAQQHETAMTGNANFTTPLPPATEYTAARTAYETALANFNTAQQSAKLATTVKDTARLDLETALTQRGNYVELTANSATDPAAVVESAGFAVRSPRTPPGIPATVSNLAITAGDHAGELDLQWDPVPGAKSYDVQTSPEPMTETSWTAHDSVTKSKAVILGLTSGQKTWVRVRAVGPGGIGAWSDPATKIVP